MLSLTHNIKSKGWKNSAQKYNTTDYCKRVNKVWDGELWMCYKNTRSIPVLFQLTDS